MGNPCKSSPLKLMNQITPNLAGMVPGWVPFKIVSDSPALHSRWLLLLKIEISSNGQNCSILSQNVPKFELYKHNDEFFSMCDRIFYERTHPGTIPARFGLIWFSDFRGEDLNAIFYQNMPNLHNRYISAERKISQKNLEYMQNYFLRWLLLLKIEISSIVHCCFSISQNELKFELQLHGKE
jgi:hypothetical protein